MTIYDYLTRNYPPYHDTLFLEGFKPWEIMTAAKQSILDAAQPEEITITGEVKTK